MFAVHGDAAQDAVVRSGEGGDRLKIEISFSSRKVEKAIAKTRSRHLARSPVSMASAT